MRFMSFVFKEMIPFSSSQLKGSFGILSSFTFYLKIYFFDFVNVFKHKRNGKIIFAFLREIKC